MCLKCLKNYDGQTIGELVALKSTHQIPTILYAMLFALVDKPRSELSLSERVILAVVMLDAEVNNGGYAQFFINSSGEFTPIVVHALELIGCPKIAAITEDAIEVLHLPEYYDAELVDEKTTSLSDEASAILTKCDLRYYDTNEKMFERLFAYVEAHQDEIRIPYRS